MTRTVPQFCADYQICQDRALEMIANGEIRAINIGKPGGRRPSWRITEEAMREWERGRENRPAPKTQRKRRRQQTKEYV